MRKGRRVMAFMALIALLPALCLCSAFGLPPQYARVYHAALCDKVELLAKTLLERETMDGRDVAKLVGLEREESSQASEQTGDEEPK